MAIFKKTDFKWLVSDFDGFTENDWTVFFP